MSLQGKSISIWNQMTSTTWMVLYEMKPLRIWMNEKEIKLQTKKWSLKTKQRRIKLQNGVELFGKRFLNSYRFWTQVFDSEGASKVCPQISPPHDSSPRFCPLQQRAVSRPCQNLNFLIRCRKKLKEVSKESSGRAHNRLIRWKAITFSTFSLNKTQIYWKKRKIHGSL